MCGRRRAPALDAPDAAEGAGSQKGGAPEVVGHQICGDRGKSAPRELLVPLGALLQVDKLHGASLLGLQRQRGGHAKLGEGAFRGRWKRRRRVDGGGGGSAAEAVAHGRGLPACWPHLPRPGSYTVPMGRAEGESAQDTRASSRPPGCVQGTPLTCRRRWCRRGALEEREEGFCFLSGAAMR